MPSSPSFTTEFIAHPTNCGNCKIENKNLFTGKSILPVTLKFGQSVDVSFEGPCEAAEVDVTTDQGSWSFTY